MGSSNDERDSDQRRRPGTEDELFGTFLFLMMGSAGALIALLSMLLGW